MTLDKNTTLPNVHWKNNVALDPDPNRNPDPDPDLY
jgi:hypothetical protein